MTARSAGGDLELGAPGADGGGLRFPAIWLRDNCPCPQCRGPRTGTTVVDGFGAAAFLREDDPGSFRTLASASVPFGIDDPGTALRACQPLIDLDPHGRIRGVPFTNRSRGTLRQPYGDLDSASSRAALERHEVAA